jgi:citrate lyase synthetase
VVIGTDYIASCKSNYHTITATTARIELKEINIDKVAVSVGEATSSYHKSLSRNVTIKTIDEHGTFEQNVNKYNGTIDQYYPLGLRPSGRYW